MVVYNVVTCDFKAFSVPTVQREQTSVLEDA